MNRSIIANEREWVRRSLLFRGDLFDTLTPQKGISSPTFTRDVTATYKAQDQSTQTAGVNVARFDWTDPLYPGVNITDNASHPDHLSYPTSGIIDYRSGLISLWYLPEWNANDNLQHFLLDTRPGVNQNAFFLAKSTINTMEFGRYGNTAGGYIDLQTPALSFLANTWRHTVVAWTPVTSYMWQDGVQATSLLTSSWTTPVSMGTPMHVGEKWNATLQAKAKLRRIRIYGPRSDADFFRLADYLFKKRI